jgi:phage terminase large subunit-like protein
MGARGRNARTVHGSTRRNRALIKIERIPDRGDRAIARIERLVIARGPNAGKRTKLRPWQQDIIRGILPMISSRGPCSSWTRSEHS